MHRFEKLFGCDEKYVLLTDNLGDNKAYLDMESQRLGKLENSVVILNSRDVNSKKNFKRCISRIRRVFKKCENDKSGLGIEIFGKNVLVVIITNDFCSDNVKNAVVAINAVLITDKEKRYNLIYDTVCDELDKCFKDNNYCDFKNDVCVAKRNCVSKRNTMGCCYHFDRRGLFGKMNLCENLVDRGCSIKCISCKLYTCNYIKKKYRIRDIFLLDYFFNPIQKIVIIGSCFKTKEQIMKKLLFWDIIG